MIGAVEPTSDEARSPLRDETTIPPELAHKWQQIVNLIADIVQVPASLIVRLVPPKLAIVVASESKGNPYGPGETYALDTGLYCEHVMKSRTPLLIPDARIDPVWDCNPDLEVGMVSYLGFPITWPSGDVFGTICVLDVKANAFTELYQRLVLQFRDVIQADLKVLTNFDARLAAESRARLEESERARRVLLDSLEHLEQTQARLLESQEQLQAAVHERDEFLSIASHELRTPITSLQLVVQGLTRGIVPPSPENTLRTFALIERQIGRLTRLIDELLEVSRIQAGRIDFDIEDVDLVATVRDVVHRFETDLLRAHCKVTLSALAPVVGRWDRSKLEQIATNLLTNAIKFGAGKPIEISVEEAPRGTARLTVTDHGIGIAPDRLPRIFERFERAVSSREYGGLGLGLYIVRTLVQGLGGNVRAASLPGSGSTFTIELPCSHAICTAQELASHGTKD